jgi:peptide/nickel transport system permease protein
MVLTMLFAVGVAVPAAVLAGWKACSWIDQLVMALAISSFSGPVS